MRRSVVVPYRHRPKPPVRKPAKGGDLRARHYLAVGGASILGTLAVIHGLPLVNVIAVGEPAVVSRVIDGDTFVLTDGERVRISNIDTAEMPPRSRCDEEAVLAVAARDRLRALLPAGGGVELFSIDRDRDVYGRLLRKVRVEGRDVGDMLVTERLAQRWRGSKATWC